MKLHSKALTALTLFASQTGLGHSDGGNPLARCAAQGSAETKIVACTEASRSTPYPWILYWVHLELARAHRERGDIRSALASYARSLAAAERGDIRREMEELSASLTQ